MFKYIVLLSIFSLTSCSVGEEYTHDYFISNQAVIENLNIHPSEDIIKNNWYEMFNDKDLNTLIQQAMNSNFTIQQGIERLQQSRYNYLIQSKQSYPMLDAKGEYNYSKASDNQKYAYDVNAFKVGFDVSWELDIWGKGKYISEQYFNLMRNTAYSLLSIKVSITAEVITNYIKLRETQEKLNIAYKNLRLQRDIMQTVKDKYNAGIADALALNQAEFAVEKTKTSIPPLKTQIENYKNSIAVLLGVLPNSLPANLNKYNRNITNTAFKYNVQKLYNLPLGIIRSRPDIIAAETSIYAQNAAVNEAITALYPNVSLSATFGFISNSGHSLFDKNSQIYGYTPGITLPIWHWGQLTNNIELQKHIKEEYILNYNEAMLTALAELKNAINAIEEVYKENAYSQSSLNKMRNVMELTRNKYENGLIEFTDVAIAEQDYLQAQNALAESNASILQYLTAFYKATGGGYNIKTCQ
ncbi:MAG: TolC family protein [Acetobacter sp.]|nr:TolC family protein [Acetobacter sp.]